MYTYFNIPRNINTWIDHVISTEYDVSSVEMCTILPLNPDNVSDHLPIRLCMHLSLAPTDCSINLPYQHRDNQVFTNWNRSMNNSRYSTILSDLLKKTPQLNVHSGDDPMSHSQ